MKNKVLPTLQEILEKSNFGHVEILSKALNWIYIPLIALILSPDDLGSLVLILSYSLFFQTIFAFGQIRLVLRNFAERSTSALVVPCIISLGIFVLVSIVLVISNINLMLAALTGFLLCEFAFLTYAIRTTGNRILFLKIKIGFGVMRIISSTALAFKGCSGEYTYVISEILSITVVVSVYSGPIKKLFYEFTVTAQEFFKNIIEGKALAAHSLLLLSVATFDKVILQKYISLEDIGLFGVTVSFATTATFVLAYFAQQYEILIYRAESSSDAMENSRLFFTNATIWTLMYIPVSTAAYAVYCHLWEMNPLWLEFSLINLVLVMNIYNLKTGYFFTWEKRNKLVLIQGALYSIVTLLLYLFFVPKFGIKGVVYSQILGILPALIYSHANMQKHINNKGI